jgi:hypothetical protein
LRDHLLQRRVGIRIDKRREIQIDSLHLLQA